MYTRLKIQFWQQSVGSIPSTGTNGLRNFPNIPKKHAVHSLCSLLRFSFALLAISSAAQAIDAADDIRVYFPSGRLSLYWGCDVIEPNASTLSANCYLHLEDQPGINPYPPTGTEPSLHMEVFTPGVSPWYRVDHVSGAGACVLVATYAVPFPGVGYIVQCDGTDFIYGDTFDGSPFSS